MDLTFYDEVVIAPQTDAADAELGAIDGHRGVVLGMSRDQATGHIVSYAIGVDSDVVCMVDRAHLHRTGTRRRRGDYMSGASIRVSQDGLIVD